MNPNYENITLALAGILQASSLVNELAFNGKCDPDAFQTCIYSIYQLDPPDIESIYTGKQNLRIGFQELLTIFGKLRKNINPHVTRYAWSSIVLERQLAKKPEMINEIKKRVQQGKFQVEYFSYDHSNVIANLADIYTSTISTLSLRIKLIGKADNLYRDDIANKTRALLLAAIRSAVLWHQVGGRRWQLFLNRNKILQTATEMLKKM